MWKYICERASIKYCILMSKSRISSFSDGIKIIYGKYPKNREVIDFELLNEITKNNKISIVLHVDFGIPSGQKRQTISIGISKINARKNLQKSHREGVLNYFNNLKKEICQKWYDLRKTSNRWVIEVNKIIKDSILLMGSRNRA